MNLSAWLPLFAVGIVFSIAVLIHLARNDAPFMPKWAWAAIIVFTMPLGGVMYLLVVAGVGVQREDAEGRRP